MRKLKVVVKEPFKNAEVREIKAGLETLQGLVDGLIEAVTPDDFCYEHNIVTYVNDEGKLYHLLPNLRVWDGADFLVGTCVFVKADEEGSDISMTDEEIQHVLKLCRETAFHIDEFR